MIKVNIDSSKEIGEIEIKGSFTDIATELGIILNEVALKLTNGNIEEKNELTKAIVKANMEIWDKKHQESN